MQPQATIQVHPTRSAPLCKDCRHSQGSGVACNHPAYPANVTTGKSALACRVMRDDTEAGYYLKPEGLPLCGKQALLFEAREATSALGHSA